MTYFDVMSERKVARLRFVNDDIITYKRSNVGSIVNDLL
jgi:hypothetical protein